MDRSSEGPRHRCRLLIGQRSFIPRASQRGFQRLLAIPTTDSTRPQAVLRLSGKPPQDGCIAFRGGQPGSGRPRPTRAESGERLSCRGNSACSAGAVARLRGSQTPSVVRVLEVQQRCHRPDRQARPTGLAHASAHQFTGRPEDVRFADHAPGPQALCE